MKFTKMQGAGNDYVYVDCTKLPLANPSEVAVRVSDKIGRASCRERV